MDPMHDRHISRAEIAITDFGGRDNLKAVETPATLRRPNPNGDKKIPKGPPINKMFYIILDGGGGGGDYVCFNWILQDIRSMSSLINTLLETAPLIHRTPTPEGIIKRAKYCARGLVFARYTQEWFEFLNTRELALIVKNNPCLYHKLQRPYLNRTLNTGARLEALKQHYQFILTHFPAPLREEVYVAPGKLLVALPVKNVGTVEVRLACSGMQKEGDLMIVLRNRESKKPITTLSFSVWKCGPDGKEVFIGGLQGDKATNEDVIVAVTRSLYGLRPKALLVFVLQQFAALWGITRLRAVSDSMHIYRHYQTRRDVAASYDPFWAECGGIQGPDEIFDLPVAFVPRDISTLRVNKRQMYRRRYAMLEQIAEEVRNQMSNHEELLAA